mgnify:CR=1 FL=1
MVLSALAQKGFMLSNLGRHEESEAISKKILDEVSRRGMKGELSLCIHNIGLNAIAQWTATLKTDMPQGLGTGSLFTNNFESPLYVEGG